MLASDILKIDIKEADKILPGDTKSINAAYRKLAKIWHPDHNKDPNAADVFAHLSRLKDFLINKPSVQPSPKITITTKEGKVIAIKALTSHAIDAGVVHVTKHAVCYVMKGVTADKLNIPNLRFADENMRKYIEPYLPQSEKVIELDDGCAFIYRRTAEQFLLADLIEKQVIPPAHLAWIISGMENLASYLEWLGVTHGGICPQNILVSLKYHSVSITGPSLFITPFGQRPKALPNRTLNLIPRLIVKGQTVDPTVDLELLRLTARECVKAPTLAALTTVNGMPPEVASWIMSFPAAKAVQDYASWERARDAGFGQRKFLKWEIPPDQFYPA